MTDEERVRALLERETSLPFGFAPYQALLPLLDCRAALRIPQEASTVIAVLFPYYVKVEGERNLSRYAMIPDYHEIAGNILEKIAALLQQEFLQYQFVSFVDNSPIREVKAAELAGLGVIGQNGLLIHAHYGSYVFIGEIVTDLPLAADAPLAGHCLACGNCLRACPGGALRAGEGVELARCRSYISQKKGELSSWESEQLRSGGLVWGCDLCNESCPMNHNAQETPIPEFKKNLAPLLTEENLAALLHTHAFSYRGEKVINRNLALVNKMASPLETALREYQSKEYARFHMPGHKGASLPIFGDLTAFDLTEVEGTDSLFEANGALAELEAIFTQLYATSRTVLSVGGSTLCIQAMFALIARPGGKVIAGRNLHTAAVNAMALLGLTPLWVYPDQADGLIGQVNPAQIEALLQKESEICAVYVTSPDYFGVRSDLAAISALCKKYRVPLLVDNAHGAHLKFIGERLHPMDLGADLCCDSLHKTLPALTGAALLHCKNESYAGDLKSAMSLFASTSPSYLILLSCEYTANFLRGTGRKRLAATVARCEKIRALAAKQGFCLPGNCDPMRITLPLSGTNLSEEELRLSLRRHGIMEELLNPSACVLLAAPFNREEDFLKLEDFLREWTVHSGPLRPYPLLRPKQRVSLREAILLPRERIPVSQAAGRIAAQAKITCPPGIPLVMPGEEYSKDDRNLLKNVGILEVDVLK